MSTSDFTQTLPLAGAGAIAGRRYPALEIIAGILTQFSHRSRDSFIAMVAALALALMLVLALPAQAQSATTATVAGPTSLPEGGLVAQQVGNCPEKAMEIPTKGGNESVAAWYQRVIAFLNANRYDRHYCEFRDDGGESNRSDRTHEYTQLWVSINNFEAGVEYQAQLMPNSRMELQGTGSQTITIFNPDEAGASKKASLRLRGKPNFARDGNTTETINILGRGSAIIGTHTMTIVDDDNTYYIGRRRHHPYGAIWRSQPHCYSRECAFD